MSEAALILNVNDDEPNRYAVSRMLETAGFRVIEAGTGRAALARLAEQPDLVVLDVNLPDLDGFEVCRRIKGDPESASVAVLHLSANFIRSEHKAYGLDSGADGYLTQPIERPELIATVRALLRTRKAEHELRESRDQLTSLLTQLERAIEIRDEVLAMVSHDLRTPLATITMAADLLASMATRAGAEPKLKRQAEIIQRAAERMTRLVRDLLDMGSIDAGRLAVDKRLHPCGPILDELVEMMRSQAAQRGIELQLERTPELGDLLCDRERIVQVLANLVGNAIKFSEPGQRVRVSAERRDDTLVFSVSDDGSGIDRDKLPHIFDRYWRLKNQGREGAGLGLAIAKGLVEAHGGAINVASEPGAGSRFSVSLPLSDPALP